MNLHGSNGPQNLTIYAPLWSSCRASTFCPVVRVLLSGDHAGADLRLQMTMNRPETGMTGA